MSEVTVQELQDYQAQQQTLVTMRDHAIALADNHNFRKLILEGFCTTEAARYVQEAGDPLLGKEERADALAMAMASGHLKRFLSITIQMGNQAARNIASASADIEQIRAEGGE